MIVKYCLIIGAFALLAVPAAHADSLSFPTPQYSGPAAEITHGMTGSGNPPAPRTDPAEAGYDERAAERIVQQRGEMAAKQRLRHEAEQRRAQNRAFNKVDE